MEANNLISWKIYFIAKYLKIDIPGILSNSYNFKGLIILFILIINNRHLN